MCAVLKRWNTLSRPEVSACAPTIGCSAWHATASNFKDRDGLARTIRESYRDGSAMTFDRSALMSITRHD